MHNKEANEMNIHVKIINESGKFEARQSMCEFSCWHAKVLNSIKAKHKHARALIEFMI